MPYTHTILMMAMSCKGQRVPPQTRTSRLPALGAGRAPGRRPAPWTCCETCNIYTALHMCVYAHIYSCMMIFPPPGRHLPKLEHLSFVLEPRPSWSRKTSVCVCCCGFRRACSLACQDILFISRLPALGAGRAPGRRPAPWTCCETCAWARRGGPAAAAHRNVAC